MAYPNDGKFPAALVGTTDMALHSDGDTVLAAHMNTAQAEIIQIEAALGVNPNGASATVAARMTAAEASVGTHAALSTAVHGMGASVVVGTDLPQTLTNKTLTNPVVNGATLNGNLAGSPTFTGNVSFGGNVSVSGTATGLGNPTGTVIMMLGAGAVPGYLPLDGTATITPATYPALCTWLGVATTLTLPDLSDRFPVGASGTKPNGGVGGSDTVVLSAANLPAHTHDMGHSHSVTVDAGGIHEHSGNYQSFGVAVRSGGYDLVRPFTQDNYASQGSGSWAGHNNTAPIVTFTGGSHTHTGSVSVLAGTTGSAGSGTAVTVTPKFFAMRFLIKT